MIRRCAGLRRVGWSTHAARERIQDGLNENEIVQALTRCDLIEDYSQKTRWLPDCLVFSWLADSRPMHAVIGCNEEDDEILIITVYRPDDRPEDWENDYRTRKT